MTKDKQTGADKRELFDVIDAKYTERIAGGPTWGRRLTRKAADELAARLGAWAAVIPHESSSDK